jgi:hypothetical protein
MFDTASTPKGLDRFMFLNPYWVDISMRNQ